MVELRPVPFVDLIERMRLEFANRGSMFDLPARKWAFPPGSSETGSVRSPMTELDMSVEWYGRTAANPLGPAAGPHTQMAQNIVLSWLAGGRIIELKTVQIQDHLTIPRPCIDMTGPGFNIEWSQELRLEQSLDQYIQAALLIYMLRFAPDAFGFTYGDCCGADGGDLSDHYGATIFDISVGYDLVGVTSEPVRRFLYGMRDADSRMTELLEEIHDSFGVRDRFSELPADISGSVTLSTHHGCPPDEIERIGEFLIGEMGFDLTVKMNPAMLGQSEVEHLLYDVLGYRDIRLSAETFTSAPSLSEVVELTRRLTGYAESRGRCFGVKYSNTLEVINDRPSFSSDIPTAYLSGPPLHVITMTLADRFREEADSRVPISFSAGVDRSNVADVVSCGFVPVTVCTDLLQPGGYSRFSAYLSAMADRMIAVGASNMPEFIAQSHGFGDADTCDVDAVALLNSTLVADSARCHPRYRADKNQRQPKRIDSHLTAFDCLACDKCVPVCPNDANFVYVVDPFERIYRDRLVEVDAPIVETGPERLFQLSGCRQIGNFADFCISCGLCDTFCPEYDGPYLMKPSLFSCRESFDAACALSRKTGESPVPLVGESLSLETQSFVGFLLEGEAGTLRLTGCIDGCEYVLNERAERDGYVYRVGEIGLFIDSDENCRLTCDSEMPDVPARIDFGRFWMMRALLDGLSNPACVHQVNVGLMR